jgi:DNA-binding beta-propeller fold protein YncE
MTPAAKKRLAAVISLALVLCASPEAPAPPLPKGKDVPASGVLVMDDCDEDYQGKPAYADNLSYIDASGKVAFRVSGLNNCESIGSNHMVAVDPKRGWIWALENVGRSVRKFDRKGKELLSIKDVKGSAVAVDPETGNVWVLTSAGRIDSGKTVVYDAKGKEVASYDVTGWDIAYDPKGKAFWIAGRKLAKVAAKTGKVAFDKEITTWSSSCVAVHPETGKVWVTVRRYGPQIPGSKNQLLGFDNDGTPKHTVELGDEDEVTPFHVSVGPKGVVWVTLFGKSVRRYSAAGKLEAELKHKAITASADLTSSDVWVVTQTEVLRLSAAGKVLKRAAHRKKTTQAWIVGF